MGYGELKGWLYCTVTYRYFCGRCFLAKLAIMRLVIDQGNTHTKAAIYTSSGMMKPLIVTDEWSVAALQQLYRDHGIRSCILSSVGNWQPSAALDWLRQQPQFWELTHQTPLPICNAYKTPQTLGKDRIAAAVGAWGINPNGNSLVVDAGTCVTYEHITAQGVYLGGYIAPGLMMRLQAMHHFTARLPLLEKQRLELGVGSTTADAMQAGAQRGIVHEIRGFYHDYIDTHGEVQLLLCGGDAAWLSPLLADIPHRVHPYLVLQGLYKILLYNESISLS